MKHQFSFLIGYAVLIATSCIIKADSTTMICATIVLVGFSILDALDSISKKLDKEDKQ